MDGFCAVCIRMREGLTATPLGAACEECALRFGSGYEDGYYVEEGTGLAVWISDSDKIYPDGALKRRTVALRKSTREVFVAQQHDMWRVVSDNYYLLDKIARCLSLDDQVISDVGISALCNAALMYDSSRSVTFKTYAHTVLWRAYIKWKKREEKLAMVLLSELDISL